MAYNTVPRRERVRVVRMAARGAARRARPRAVGRTAVLIFAPALLLGGLFLVWLGVQALGRRLFTANPYYTVRRVEVRGSGPRSQALAREYTQIREGMNLLAFDMAGVRAYVLDNAPNIRALSISRRLPDTVIIEVMERVPLARLGRGDFVADAEGYVFVHRAGQDSLPGIRNVGRAGADALTPGMRIDGPALAALHVLAACEDPELGMRATQIDVRGTDELVVYMAYAGMVRRVRVAWPGMHDPGPATRRQVLAKMQWIRAAFDRPEGRRLTQLDATIEGTLSGA